MTEQGQAFAPGDRVVHPARPEWGEGTVRQAQPINHQGITAQRLVVEFTNRGRAVINTAVAPLIAPKENASNMTRTTTGSTTTRRGWLDELEQATRNASHELWELPEAMTDPFASARGRLQATLDSYRFSTEARSLIDWAVMQTGLEDPLSKYTRQELEQAFPRFARDRDQHLKALVFQLKRGGQSALLAEAQRETRNKDARNALNKAMRG